MGASSDRPASWKFSLVLIILSLGVMGFMSGLWQAGSDILKGTNLHQILYPKMGTSFAVPWLWDKYMSLGSWLSSSITVFMMDWVRDYLSPSQLMLVRRAIFVPFSEDIIWRLPIWFLLGRVNEKWLNVLVLSSAMLFTATHRAGLAHWLVIFVVGLLLGFMVTKTKRFLPSVVLHGLLNIKGF